MFRGAVDLTFPSSDAARQAGAALQPDNDHHLHVEVDGNRLRLVAASSSAMGLLRTLDDALACLRGLGME